MRAFLPNYTLQRAESLQEALQALQQSPGSLRPFAGGTDIMVLYNAGKLPPGNFLDISRVSDLAGTEIGPDWVRLGALTTYGNILRHPSLGELFPNLKQAAFWTGAAAIQNRGTLGGNLANASPAADTPPALLSYAAEVELVSLQGKRRLSYDEFHLDYKKTQMRPDELIHGVWLPVSKQPRFSFYRKVGTRKAQAISKICLAGSVENGQVRLGLGAVAPIPASCPATRKALTELGRNPLNDKVWNIFRSEIAPIDDVRSNGIYRRKVAENLLDQFWSEYLQWNP